MHCLTPTIQQEPDFSEVDIRDGYLKLAYGFTLDTLDHPGIYLDF